MMDYDLIMRTVTSHTTEEPTMRLRFKGGRLQQMVVLRRYDNGVEAAAAEEWRDVQEVGGGE